MKKAPVEPEAWKAAGGVTLPAELVKLYDRLERLEAEQVKVEAANAERENAVDLLLKGAGVDEAVTVARASEVNHELLTEKRKVAAQAVRLAREGVARWVGAHRDELIVDRLRPVVATVIADATKLLPKLDGYAPDYDPARIAEEAPPAVVAAYRESRTLNDTFGTLLTAWWSSWTRATSTQSGGAAQVPAHLRVDEPGGLHVWERPLEVTDTEIRDGRNHDVLAVATWAEVGGYRLAGGQEVLDIVQAGRVENPWIVGEQHARRVIIPSTKAELVAPPKMVGA
ncbi:MAG: hypothetical protein WD232_08440 [Acidimicrobiales bacterium]